MTGSALGGKQNYPPELIPLYRHEKLMKTGNTLDEIVIAMMMNTIEDQMNHLWSKEIKRKAVYAEPHSTAGLLFPSQSLSGKIWLTPYLMVWDWRVSRAGPMPFCWPSCSLLFYLQLFSLSLLFLYRLVVWGWNLRTDRVSISLSRPCIADLF